jgi:uncharacterized repeat protein (TIGR03803 family)
MLAGCGGGSTPVAPIAPSNSAGGAPPPRSHNGDVLYAFQGGADGWYPYAGLLAENGQFYGTTEGGGSSNNGTVFRISPSGTKTILYNFQGGGDASDPAAGLIAGPGGVLYGDTLAGGGSGACASGPGCGTVYELVPSGSGYAEKVIYAFQGGSDGAFPGGDLLLDQSGALYGTTLTGGGNAPCSDPPSYTTGCGTVFKLTPSSSGFTESILHSFQDGNDGGNPRAALIADSTGALYGTTQYGGSSASGCTPPSGNAGCGTVFKLTPSGSSYTESILYSFQGGTDGAVPRSALHAGKNGTLIGTTNRGGEEGSSTGSHGTVFELVPSGSGYSERIIFSFDSTNAAFPYDENGLYADGNGNLYGTAARGGARCGVVFKLAPSGSSFSYKQLHSFSGSREDDGCEPLASLTADSSGSLYGTTFFGGPRKFRRNHRSGFGTIFKISP